MTIPILQALAALLTFLVQILSVLRLLGAG